MFSAPAKRLMQLGMAVGMGYAFNETCRNESNAMPTVEGKTVLITGGAQGLGKLFAQKAVSEKARAVILWDVNEKGLQATADELKNAGGKVFVQKVDVSNLDSITKAAAATQKMVGAPDVLVNNAGVVRGKYFWEHDNVKDTAFQMNINTLAPMYITREFLPSMISSEKEARVINICSAAGLVANPRMSVYCASKAAATFWSDSLRLELIQAGHDKVKVSTVCPGYINTGMFDGVKAPLLTPLLTPEMVCDAVWEGGLKGRPMIKLPWTIHLSQIFKGIMPVPTFDYVAGNLFGVYHSMDNFVGHQKK